jgi:hypothetical protein
MLSIIKRLHLAEAMFFTLDPCFPTLSSISAEWILHEAQVEGMMTAAATIVVKGF